LLSGRVLIVSDFISTVVPVFEAVVLVVGVIIVLAIWAIVRIAISVSGMLRVVATIAIVVPVVAPIIIIRVIVDRVVVLLDMLNVAWGHGVIVIGDFDLVVDGVGVSVGLESKLRAGEVLVHCLDISLFIIGIVVGCVASSMFSLVMFTVSNNVSLVHWSVSVVHPLLRWDNGGSSWNGVVHGLLNDVVVITFVMGHNWRGDNLGMVAQMLELIVIIMVRSMSMCDMVRVDID
jgi:hypothetical protein